VFGSGIENDDDDDDDDDDDSPVDGGAIVSECFRHTSLPCKCPNQHVGS